MKVLHITNMFPTPEKVYFGIFVKSQIENLNLLGVSSKTVCIGRYFGGYAKIFRLERDIDWADILHCHFGHVGSLGLFWKFIKRKLLVVSYYGSDLLAVIGPKARFFSKINSYLSRYVDCVIVQSRQLAGKVGSGNIAIIPNGVDMTLFRELDRMTARQKIGLTGYLGKIILFLGQRKNRVKNFILFQEALRMLDFDFKYLALENIPPEDVVYYINSADVCVLTSFYEGSPNVIKEAMACNRPIVSVAVGDVREVFGDIKGCFLAQNNATQIANSIRSAFDFERTDGRSRIIDLGLDAQATAGKILGVYKSLLGN